MSVAEVERNSEQPKPTKKPRVQIAHIASHLNIFRNFNEPKEGPVTRAEQIEAVEKFIRHHERQLVVGQRLLAELQAAAAAEAAS